MKRLTFRNPDAYETLVKLEVSEASIDHILMWYGGFYSGDDYTVEIDGVPVELNNLGVRKAA